jgi:hypothetical protein
MRDLSGVLMILALLAIVVFGLISMPTCGPGEVRVRAHVGFACVAGHR